MTSERATAVAPHQTPTQASTASINRTTDYPAVKPRCPRQSSRYAAMVRPRAEYQRGRRLNRSSIIEVAYGPRSGFFYGAPGAVIASAVAVECAYQWTLKRDAIAVPIQCAPDIEARLIAEGWTVLARLVR